jgi:hypothetical protein
MPPSTQEPTPSAGPLKRYTSLPYGRAIPLSIALCGDHLLAAGGPGQDKRQAPLKRRRLVRMSVVPPAGLEPTHPAPEASALSNRATGAVRFHFALLSVNPTCKAGCVVRHPISPLYCFRVYVDEPTPTTYDVPGNRNDAEGALGVAVGAGRDRTASSAPCGVVCTVASEQPHGGALQT